MPASGSLVSISSSSPGRHVRKPPPCLQNGRGIQPLEVIEDGVGHSDCQSIQKVSSWRGFRSGCRTAAAGQRIRLRTGCCLPSGFPHLWGRGGSCLCRCGLACHGSGIAGCRHRGGRQRRLLLAMRFTAAAHQGAFSAAGSTSSISSSLPAFSAEPVGQRQGPWRASGAVGDQRLALGFRRVVPDLAVELLHALS